MLFDLTDDKLFSLIECDAVSDTLPDASAIEAELASAADAVRRRHYGTDVYIRGLIEISNFCGNGCYYCGIRRENTEVTRYRLDLLQIMDCCERGYELGFRTFVLQGGEDGYFTDAMVCEIVSSIKSQFPDCAVTLSIGEKRKDSYKAFYDAGADRYLLRHETADAGHYARLHPGYMDAEKRKQCLWDLKDIGFQVGSGFLVGSPYQTTENIVEDLKFLRELQPDMIGIGPFIPHKDTPFAQFAAGNLRKCLRLISILRLMFPHALIPATTALGTVAADGRELGLMAGANVVMPNLSPRNVREHYALYDGKLHTDEEAAEHLERLKKRVEGVGYKIVTDVGHVIR